MSLSVLYHLMYPVLVLTNVLSILDTFNTGVTTFNPEIIETKELKKIYYYFGRENFFTFYLCLFYAPYFGHTLTSKGTI